MHGWMDGYYTGKKCMLNLNYVQKDSKLQSFNNCMLFAMDTKMPSSVSIYAVIKVILRVIYYMPTLGFVCKGLERAVSFNKFHILCTQWITQRSIFNQRRYYV